jgi:hypothetical protein
MAAASAVASVRWTWRERWSPVPEQRMVQRVQRVDPELEGLAGDGTWSVLNHRTSVRSLAGSAMASRSPVNLIILLVGTAIVMLLWFAP